MFARHLQVVLAGPEGERPCPEKYLDSFAMRNFTGQSRFDELLPAGDGCLEASFQVPLDELAPALEDWFRRKSYLQPQEHVVVKEASQRQAPARS
jgi:hypothetical protein